MTRVISGTRISMICGLSKYGNARDAYDEIVLGLQQDANPFTERGNRMEPIIRGLYLARFGAEQLPNPGVAAHPEHHWATCSPDDLVNLDGRRLVVDYKSVSFWGRKAWGAEDSDDVPTHYLVQMAWNAFVLNTEAMELFAAFGTDNKETGEFDLKFTRRYRFERDSGLEAMLFEGGLNFYTNHILTKTPPAMEPMRKPTKQRRKKHVERDDSIPADEPRTGPALIGGPGEVFPPA